VNSYQDLPISKWHRDSWKGFYIELQRRLNKGHWDYVPQKNGGFLGFWWNWGYLDFEETGFDYYLQLEQSKFCFKISPYDVKHNYEIRNFYRDILFQRASESGIRIRRNGRCQRGKTKTMTVAKLDYPYMQIDQNGLIDLDRTVNEIRKIEQMMEKIKTAHNIG